MNLKNLLIASSMCLATFAFAEDQKFEIPKAQPGKIALLVTDVGTIDTVAKTEEFLAKIKQFNIENAPKFSDADKAKDPEAARKEININFGLKVDNFNEEQAEIARQNRKMEAILDNLRTSIIGNETKRDIVVAKNYIQSYLDPYKDFIGVIDRANTSLAELEKAINGTSQQDLASSVVFLTIIMQDLQETSNTVNVHNTAIKKTVYTQKAVGNLRDFNGNVITAFNVVAKSSRRQTSVSKTEGYNPASDLMEDALKQIAEKIAAHYITSLDIECIGPKGDNDFDEDNVQITIDGKEFDSGDRILVGKHVLVAEADGYKTITKDIKVKTGDNKELKLKFKKEITSEQ